MLAGPEVQNQTRGTTRPWIIEMVRARLPSPARYLSGVLCSPGISCPFFVMREMGSVSPSRRHLRYCSYPHPSKASQTYVDLDSCCMGFVALRKMMGTGERRRRKR